MLVDNVTLAIKAGNGGNGKVSFFRNRGGPDGGNGGNGGSIFFQGNRNMNDLHTFRFKKSLKAENGIQGGNKHTFGKNAPDMIIFVPLGTRITETDTGIIYEISDDKTPVLLARGGVGGRGNDEFKTSTNQAPQYAESGTLGQEKNLFLELRLIADIGLIGLPNAGKSSLLAMMTNASPKIGAYPFTTLEPNIGMLNKFTIADIPGLIEGASAGKGLGITFLKHIEKTQVLLHCIDVTDPDPVKTYNIVRHELAEHNPELLEKLEIILLTKTDLADEVNIEKSAKLFKKLGKDVLTVSVFDEVSLKKLIAKLEDLTDLTTVQKSQ
jgi:GTP-binding protein